MKKFAALAALMVALVLSVFVAGSTAAGGGLTVTISVPGNPQNLSGTVPVTVTASPSVGLGILWIDGVAVQSQAPPPFTYQWDTTAYADGPHTLTAHVETTSGKRRWGDATLPVVVNNAPPPQGLLSWAPPGYDGSGSVRDCTNYPGYTVWHLSQATLDVNSGTINPTQDVCIIQDSVVTQARIMGWRNVVWIGGEINQTNTNDNGLTVVANSGVVHLEGLWIHGPGLRDGMGVMMGKAPPTHGGTLRVQNSRLEAHTFGDFHGDNIQLWGDPGIGGGWVGGVGQVQVDRFTGVTDLQGIFLGNHDGALEGADIRNSNVIGIGPEGGGQLYYKHYRTDIYGWTSQESFQNTWMEQRPDPGTSVWTTPGNWVVPNLQGTYWGGPADFTRESQERSDAQGQFVAWDQNPSPDVTGIVRVGPPSGGDFVPESVPGMNYVSPGYQ